MYCPRLLRSRGRIAPFWKYSKPLFLRSDVVGYGLFLGGFLAARSRASCDVLKQYKETIQVAQTAVAKQTAHNTRTDTSVSMHHCSSIG